jgi:hypothetical protein
VIPGVVAVRKRGLTVAFLGLAVAAGVWHWTSWRKSDTALSFLPLRVNDLRGRVEERRTRQKLEESC